MRPGSFRVNSFLQAMKAAWGPPKPMGTPKRGTPTAISAAPIRRGFDQGEREQIGGARHTMTPSLCALLRQRFGVIFDAAVGVGVLQQDAAESAEVT